MKIGILGSRGIPNRYGGYEQFAQYLSQGLVQRGHEVWVYSSSLHPYQKATWEGVHLIHQYDPEDRLGTFGQFVYDFYCLRDAANRNFDILLQLGYTSSAVFYPLWPSDTINFMHMDGLEWKRTKYNAAVRWFLKQMESWAARQADWCVADSVVIQERVQQVYHRNAFFIPYGAKTNPAFQKEHLEAFQVEADAYYLLIARFVPENNIELIVKGFLESQTEYPLLLVGNHKNAFGQYLVKNYKHQQIRFLGSIYDQAQLDSLRGFAKAYFHGHSVGGTNPSLLEAMACRVPILAHQNDFNCAVLGEDALYFEEEKGVIEAIATVELGKFETAFTTNNFEKIQQQYQWQHIIDTYESSFQKALMASSKTAMQKMRP